MKLAKATLDHIAGFVEQHGQRYLTASIQVNSFEEPAMFDVLLEIGGFDDLHIFQASVTESLLTSFSDVESIKLYLAVRKHIRKIKAEMRP